MVKRHGTFAEVGERVTCRFEVFSAKQVEPYASVTNSLRDRGKVGYALWPYRTIFILQTSNHLLLRISPQSSDLLRVDAYRDNEEQLGICR